jgi:hypothetical protein
MHLGELMSNYYARVLLVGEDDNGHYVNMLFDFLGIDRETASISKKVVDDYCSSDDCIVIGSPKGGFNIDDLDVLNGKINIDTRIDISAHGGKLYPVIASYMEGGITSFLGTAYSYLTFAPPTYRHSIDNNDSMLGILTSTLLQKLGEIANNQPLHINLWSCYSGQAADDAKYLPNSSILVTHTSSETSSLGNLDDDSLLKIIENDSIRHLSPFEQFSEFLPYQIAQSATFSISKGLDQNPLHFNFSPSLQYVLQSPADVLSDAQSSFNTFAAKNEALISFNSYSDEQLQNFQKSFLQYQRETDLSSFRNTLKNLPSGMLNSIEQNIKKSFLFEAIIQNDFDLLKIALSKGSNPNFKDGALSPLQISINNGNIEMAKLLLENGANPNPDSESLSPLKYAISDGNIEMAKLLLENGANPITISDFVLNYYIKSFCLKKLADENKEIIVENTLDFTDESLEDHCPGVMEEFSTLVSVAQSEFSEL